MLVLLYVGLVWTSCYGVGATSYSSSWSFNDKPILRIGSDQPPDESTTDSGLKEPSWVTLLRGNMQEVVEAKGFENAQSDIMDLIKTADEEVNERRYPMPSLREAIKGLRTDDIFFSGNARDDEKDRFKPRWEEQLTKYVTKLMILNMVPQEDLNKHLLPYVEEMEESHGVNINNIDVDPYGAVKVRWEYKKMKQPPMSSDLRSYGRSREFQPYSRK